MAFRTTGAFNGFVAEPSKYAVGFVRDPKRFMLNQYVQYVPSPAVLSRYWQMDPDDPSRVVNLDENSWAYGAYRPAGRGTTLNGQWLPVTIQRWDFPYTLDDQTIESWRLGGFDAQVLYNAVTLQRGMTHRTARVLNQLVNANWGNNTSSANTLNNGRGFLDTASGTELNPATGAPNPNYRAIFWTLQAAKIQIDILTNSAVGPGEYIWLISPALALAIGGSGELAEIVKQMINSPRLLIEMPEKGAGKWRNSKWGCPDEYAGFEIVVEDTVQTTVRRNADGVTVAQIFTGKNFILNGGTSYILTRPDGIDTFPGKPSFATIQLHWYEYETKISLFSEPKHELVEGHATFQDAPVVVAAQAGWQITGCLSPTFVY